MDVVEALASELSATCRSDRECVADDGNGGLHGNDVRTKNSRLTWLPYFRAILMLWGCGMVERWIRSAGGKLQSWSSPGACEGEVDATGAKLEGSAAKTAGRSRRPTQG
jgi:hypothetical protein